MAMPPPNKSVVIAARAVLRNPVLNPASLSTVLSLLALEWEPVLLRLEEESKRSCHTNVISLQMLQANGKEVETIIPIAL
jgi:hypothetical protein